MYGDVVRNGIFGTDYLYPDTLSMSSFSPIYIYLANEELKHSIAIIEKLQIKTNAGMIEEDFGILCDSQLYWYRGLEFVKLARNAVVRDKSNPNKILEDSYFDSIFEDIEKLDANLKLCAGNSFAILELMFGSNWKLEMKNVLATVSTYANTWEQNQFFMEIENSKIQHNSTK
jgi:hypothetical protein